MSDLSTLLHMPTTTLVASLVGAAAGAIVSGAVWLFTNKSLEMVKAKNQRDLDRHKIKLQGELDDRKAELQTALQKDLETFRAGIADETAAQNARRGYEFEARKRLYGQVEPLLFQLFEAAEGAFHAVASLVRTQRQGDLPAWLAGDAYYIRSIIHRAFLPLAILRLIQKSTTLIDLNLDPSIRLRYALLKECYLTWTDDFGVAEAEPALDYLPNAPGWDELRKTQPAKYWRQGLVIGHLDRLVDAMIMAESTPPRPMNFGEFETALATKPDFKAVYEPAQDVFLSFDFVNRPVLGRMLLTYACLMHTLMSVYERTSDGLDPAKILSDFALSPEKSKRIRWWKDGEPDVLRIVHPYAQRRVKQATAFGSYVQF